MGSPRRHARRPEHTGDRREAADRGRHRPAAHRRRVEEASRAEPPRGARAPAQRLTARAARLAHPLGQESRRRRDDWLMRLRPRSVTLLAALVAGVLTDLVIAVPSIHFAYRSVALHAMLETLATVIALLTTILLWGRLQQRQRRNDLLLFMALALLTTTNLVFAAVPAAIWTDPHPFSIWTTVFSSAVAAALLAAAALARPVRLHDYEKAARISIVLMAIG